MHMNHSYFTVANVLKDLVLAHIRVFQCYLGTPLVLKNLKQRKWCGYMPTKDLGLLSEQKMFIPVAPLGPGGPGGPL